MRPGDMAMDAATVPAAGNGARMDHSAALDQCMARIVLDDSTRHRPKR
jgi:hypothetical protein